VTGYADQPKAMLRKTIVHAELERQMGEEEMTLPVEEELRIAIGVLRAKCERLKILIGAERGPGSRWVKVQMALELKAIEVVISHVEKGNAA